MKSFSVPGDRKSSGNSTEAPGAKSTGSKIPPMMAITNYQGIAKRIALWLGFEDIGDIVLSFNPENPLAQLPPQPPALPGGIPQGIIPGVPPPGLPPALPPGLPLPGVPNIPMQPVPGNGNRLPPEILQLIANNIMQGRQP